MTQSSKLRFFKGEQRNVQGWLRNVQTFRTPKEPPIVVDSIPVENFKRNRKGSFASEDSVNLDELINANFTTDMDDETALPDLGDLELDDSTDDFWKLAKPEALNTDLKTITELDWSPTENNANNLKTSLPVTPSSNRSGSISSENSLPQYSKYSERSLSRQSNYSTASSTSIRTGIPTPSRSKTIGSTKRASHIPTPASSPKPKRSTSSSIKPTATKRIPQRASHIPTVHRPGSPLQQSRIRSPTPGPRNSLFPPKKQEKPSGLRPPSASRIGTLKRT